MNAFHWTRQLSRRSTSFVSTVLYPKPEPLPRTRAFGWATGVVALAALLFATVRADAVSENLPLSPGFMWPQKTAHVALAQAFLRQIPPQASLSAQSSLVPHMSHRTDIYLFPMLIQARITCFWT